MILWNQVKLLDFSQGMVERRVKEAIYINMSPNNLTMNRDSVRHGNLCVIFIIKMFFVCTKSYKYFYVAIEAFKCLFLTN